MMKIANRFVSSLALGWALWLDFVGGRQLHSSSASDELISRAHRPERYCVTQPADPPSSPLDAPRVVTGGRRTNSPVGELPLSTDHRANPLIDIWTRLSVQTEYWRARNLGRPRPFQRCSVFIPIKYDVRKNYSVAIIRYFLQRLCALSPIYSDTAQLNVNRILQCNFKKRERTFGQVLLNCSKISYSGQNVSSIQLSQEQLSFLYIVKFYSLIFCLVPHAKHA